MPSHASYPDVLRRSEAHLDSDARHVHLTLLARAPLTERLCNVFRRETSVVVSLDEAYAHALGDDLKRRALFIRDPRNLV